MLRKFGNFRSLIVQRSFKDLELLQSDSKVILTKSTSDT